MVGIWIKIALGNAALVRANVNFLTFINTNSAGTYSCFPTTTLRVACSLETRFKCLLVANGVHRSTLQFPPDCMDIHVLGAGVGALNSNRQVTSLQFRRFDFWVDVCWGKRCA